jgi:hypothetical protein
MEIRVRLIISCVISFDATFRQGACSPIWMRPSRITANPLSPHESAILQPSRMGLRTSRSCLTLRVHLGCVRSRLCILGETGIARIPRYTNCAALVLVCSLVVHALRVSLHQERAIVGASHWQFWFLAGGVSGTLTAHDERAVASGHVSYRAEVLVLATKGSRNAQASPHPREATR